MRDVFIVADNILSPIGVTTSENLANLEKNVSGVKRHNEGPISPTPFYAALFDEGSFTSGNVYTKFEQMIIASVSDAAKDTPLDLTGANSIMIISSTKGNVSRLEDA